MSNKLMKSLAGASLLLVFWSPLLFFIPIILILISEKSKKNIVIKMLIVLTFSVLSYLYPTNIQDMLFPAVFGICLVIVWNPISDWLDKVNNPHKKL